MHDPSYRYFSSKGSCFRPLLSLFSDRSNTTYSFVHGFLMLLNQVELNSHKVTKCVCIHEVSCDSSLTAEDVHVFTSDAG